MDKMETGVVHSNCTVIDMKPQPTEIWLPKLEPTDEYCPVKIDHKDAGNAVTVKDEAHVDISTPKTEIKLDAVNVTNAGIQPNNVKTELNPGDNNVLLHFPFSNGSPGEREVASAGKRIHQCVICAKCFKRKEDLSRHVNIHTRERNHKCETCNKHFTRKDHLTNHLKIHSREKDYKCDSCSKYFRRNVDLSRHMLVHTGEKNHECETCKKCFATKQRMLGHSKTHSNERNFPCDTCSKCFPREEQLLNHIKTHTNESNYKCEICHRCFPTNDQLLNHVKIHAGARNCYVACEEYFMTKQKMSRHAGETNYQCEICSKNFTRKANLSSHMKIHTDERNYGCEICGKCFRRKEHLSNHIKMHLGERNYECEICNKCFTTNQHLVGHWKTHTGERNYECEICHKCFTRKQNMLKHIETHNTGRRKYECEICAKCFVRERDLWYHAVENSCGSDKLLERKTPPEESSEEKTLQKLSYDTRSSIKEERSIKEEISVFINEQKFEIDSDSADRKPSMASSEIHVDTPIIEDKPNLIEIFNLRQSINHEIIIKEENIMDIS